MPSSYDEISEKIKENNQDVNFETVSRDPKKRFLEGKRANHASFFVDDSDYITDDKDSNKIVCVKCTNTFFNIFFKDQYDEDDKAMQEIFKMKVYMDWIPDEEVFKCRNNPSHIEIAREPQIKNPDDKTIMGAGIANYPEYVSYLDPNAITGDFILTANTNKRKRVKPIFQERSEEEIFDSYSNSKRY